jgi:hypothetical protein
VPAQRSIGEYAMTNERRHSGELTRLVEAFIELEGYQGRSDPPRTINIPFIPSILDSRQCTDIFPFGKEGRFRTGVLCTYTKCRRAGSRTSRPYRLAVPHTVT